MLEKQLDDLNKETQNKEFLIDDMNMHKKKLMNRLYKLKTKVSMNKGRNLEQLENECNDLKGNLNTLSTEKAELEELINICNSEELITFSNGRFSDEMRKTVMDLVAHNVSINKIPEVIKSVIGGLTSYNAEKIRTPSTGTRKAMLEEALIVAHQHVAESMLKEGVNGIFGNCLHGDGTSKYSRHYQNFQVTTNSGELLSFGLSEVSDSDATAVLQNFMDTIGDICDVIDGDHEKKLHKLVVSIKNTMSDLGPVNPLFNAKLKAVREELLPKVIDNWEYLDQGTQSEMGDMGNFFCKLHLLSNFATECDKVLN